MGEETPEVTITYETLFELLRREKDRSELQKLDSTFLANILRYLKDKYAIINKQQNELFAAEERKKTEEQLENIRKLIKDLYNRREKKIAGVAIEKSRNKAMIVDNSVFLKEEKEVFENLIKVLDMGRERILNYVLEMKEPASIEPIVIENKEEEQAKPVAVRRDTKTVRFLSAVPKFVGRELEEYGPFFAEDIASLPAVIADILIKKGRAEEISEE
ncbi:MAG TPA: hypothetical protein VFF28_05680 [Candidatus Nanoarchaeia archaeon]|nr:hypothetical protein [Candidatus Nanoarchaeia archaeon]